MMRNLLVKYFLFLISTVFCLLTVIMIFSCSHTTEAEYNSDKEFSGQIVWDLVYGVVKPDGTVWTWGPNFAGTLGNGNLITNDVPVRVLNLKNVITIDLNEGIGVAADNDGYIWFWGNRITYLELPEKDTVVTTPVKISFLQNIETLNILGNEVNLLKNDGTVWFITLDRSAAIDATKFFEHR